jgi:hypothetical protein
MMLTQYVMDNIEGRLALMHEGEPELLIKYASLEGDHVEIGCLWGGSAILAALAKRKAKSEGHIYTIDFMTGGYWVDGDPGAKLKVPTMKAVLDNLKTFGVDESVTVLKTFSDPWPLEDVKPVTVLIDGGHSYEACLKDWENVKAVKPKFVLFHDYATGKHPGVEKVVDEVVRKDEDWRHVETVGTMIVFESVK